MNTGVLKVSMVLLIVSLYGCTPQTPENDYDYTAEGDPLLADIVTRFYQPAPEESEQLQGMTRSSYEAWIARAKSSMQELETSIDYESLVTSDQVDYELLPCAARKQPPDA